MLKNSDNYFKAPHLITIQKLLLGEGLLLSEGDIWKKQRKICTMAFHYELLRKKIPEIYNISCEYFARIPLKDMNVIEEVQKITAEVVGRLFFGTKFSEYQIEGTPLSIYLEHISSETQRLAIEPLNIILGPEFLKFGILKKHRELLKKINIFKEFSTKLINDIMKDLSKGERKSWETGTSMIEIFFEIIKSNPTDSLSNDELVSLFISFFVAGMDTTGHLIGMAAYFLMKHPECKLRVLKEIESIFDSRDKMTSENLNSLEYTTAVLKEVLRMVPPTPFLFPREAKHDINLNGFKFFKGDLLNAYFVANNFDSDYHEDPEKFDPDRWLKDSLTKRSITNDPFIFTPFSAGMRNCIGQHLAMYEAKIILGLFLKKFSYELSDKNYQMRYNFRFLYEPDDPLKYNLKKL